MQIDLDTMTASRKGVVVVKYARKQAQDELKKMGIYGSTVWYEGTENDTMYFKITNPYFEMGKYIEMMISNV